MSCAPRLISLSSSGNLNDSVSRESSVHSMMSMNWLRMKSVRPKGHLNGDSLTGELGNWGTGELGNSVRSAHVHHYPRTRNPRAHAERPAGAARWLVGGLDDGHRRRGDMESVRRRWPPDPW